jgi:hypothetical protein
VGGAVFALGLTAAAQERLDRITVPLTDPARPVTLEVALYAGTVTVNAYEGREVIIEASGAGGPFSKASTAALRKKAVASTAKKQTGQAPTPKAAKSARFFGETPPAHDTTGLTRLPRPTALDVEEAGNVVKLKGPAGQRIDLSIQVPVRTNLRLKKSATGAAGIAGAGPITVHGLDGDLEITTEAGPVTLTDVSGSVVAHSTRGTVIATVRRVAADRPMSFTSYNGNVDVTLPASLKANLILQSDRGDVFTNFGVQLGAATTATAGKDQGYKRSGRQPIRGSINGGGPDFELRTFAGSVYLRKSQ